MTRIRGKPSPALIVAILALIVAMAGGAYAAAVPKNSVGPKQLKKNAVKSGKIVNGAVTSDKIANSAVTSGKIADKGVTSGKFFLSGQTTVSFGNINGEECSSINIPAAGVTATDHVVVTPPAGWPDTFSITGTAEANAVHVAACNTFTGGGFVDPDGAGGVKFLVIR